MNARGFICTAAMALVTLAPQASRADEQGAGTGGQGAAGPAAYAKFIVGAQIQTGLFNVIRKDGKVYLEIAPAQLDHDFIQSAELVNGLGGWGVIPGGITSWTRIVRFSRRDNKMLMTWPNTYFVAPGNEPAQRAIGRTFAQSTEAVTPVVATDETDGHAVIDMSFLLGDVYGLDAFLKLAVTGPDNPDQAYSLDSDRTLFGPTKAFPSNVIIAADQTWAADNPQVVDNVPDPRALLFRIAYNFAQAPDDGYVPRIADDRVGFFDSPYLDFSSDTRYSRIVRYVVRWNMKHPMVYYLSNNIPAQYREPIRRGILDWNAAFAKIGLHDAVQVRDQPDDPNWDPDDIRYNTVIWMTESNGGGYAAENPVIDPRTGEMIRTNIVIDADVMQGSNLLWPFLVDPTTGGRFRTTAPRGERAYALGRREQADYAKLALATMGHPLTGSALTQFNDQWMESFIVHEAGHGFGLQHNFISNLAYTPKQLQSKAFTAAHGIAASVMAYAPINLWPRGSSQGQLNQTALGPYDYYVIHWGYAPISGARSPRDEVPTLNRWAQAWTNPLYRFASDEDTDYASAHAIDPRVAVWDLTNDPLAWIGGQLRIARDVMSGLDRRWPQPGHPYDQERAAFALVLGEWLRNASMPEHYIGGEYLARSHAGDPSAAPPLVQVPRAEEVRAWSLLDRYVLSDDAWNFSPATLNRLVYSEWEPFVGAQWAYDPQPRHDIPVAEIVEGFAQGRLSTMFQPLMFQRLDDLALKAKPGATMSLVDLFDWTRRSLYGDLSDRRRSSIGQVHRALQQWYARKLVQIWLAPTPGTPYDAQSLARSSLVQIAGDVRAAQDRGGYDEITQAHLASLQDVVSKALDARLVVPARN